MKLKLLFLIGMLTCYQGLGAMEGSSTQNYEDQMPKQTLVSTVSYFPIILELEDGTIIKLPGEVVALSQTLRDMQESVYISEAQEAIPFPSLPYVNKKYVQDFFKFLLNNPDALKNSEILNPLLKEFTLPKLCTFLNISSFLNIEILINGIQFYIADTIKQENSVKKRFKIVQRIQKLLPPEISTSIGLLIAPMYPTRVFTTSNPIRCLAISPDGKTIASGSFERGKESQEEPGIKLWDIQTGKVVQSINQRAYSIALNPDASLLGVGNNYGVIKILDLRHGGSVIKEFEGNKHCCVFIYQVAFSPDGKVFAYSFRHRIKIVDAQTGELLSTLEPNDNKGDINSFYFSSDGKILASDKKIFNPQTKEVLEIFERGSPYLALSSNGQILAKRLFGEKQINLWDIQNKKFLKPLEMSNGFGEMALNNDGTLLAVDEGNSIKLWNTRTGNIIKSFATGHTYAGKRIEGINALVFSPDGSFLASASDDGSIRLHYFLPPNLSLLQLVAIYSYDQAQKNNQAFNWHSYPKILNEMRALPDNLKTSLGIPSYNAQTEKYKPFNKEKYYGNKEQD